jgi:hypothetical protein
LGNEGAKAKNETKVSRREAEWSSKFLEDTELEREAVVT